MKDLAKKSTKDWLVEFPGLVLIHQKMPGYEVGQHIHDEHEFFIPLQGEVHVAYEGIHLKAGPGRMLYVPPNLDHSFSSSTQGSGERLILLVSPKLWSAHAKTKFDPAVMPANSLAKELVFYLLLHQKSKNWKVFAGALLEALSESLQGAPLSFGADQIAGKVEDARILKALKMMEEEGEESLDQVAKISGMSPRNFNRLFLKEVGMSPKSFVIQGRIEKAKKLLKETRMTVTDIAFEVGYNSLSKFITAFRKAEGQLPSDFRR